jgi:Ca2+-binding RTX toxin-like protein
MAGPGADTLVLRAKRSTAFGSPGRDQITVRAARSAADGGMGKDSLLSLTTKPGRDGRRSGGAMLIGGPGRDLLIGGRGPDRINAADGAPGDVVLCRGTRNRVLADPGDTVRGQCRWVDRV